MPTSQFWPEFPVDRPDSSQSLDPAKAREAATKLAAQLLVIAVLRDPAEVAREWLYDPTAPGQAEGTLGQPRTNDECLGLIVWAKGHLTERMQQLPDSETPPYQTAGEIIDALHATHKIFARTRPGDAHNHPLSSTLDMTLTRMVRQTRHPHKDNSIPIPQRIAELQQGMGPLLAALTDICLQQEQ